MKRGLRDKSESWNAKEHWISNEGTIEHREYVKPGDPYAMRKPLRDAVTAAMQTPVVAVEMVEAEPLDWVDVVIHYHGGGAHSYEKPNNSLHWDKARRFDGQHGIRVNDLHVNQIPQQVASAGMNVLVIIPQGSNRGSFGPASIIPFIKEASSGGHMRHRTVRRVYVSGHSAGGPTAAFHAGQADGLFLFDPVVKNDHKYVLDAVSSMAYPNVYAVFNTSKEGSYTGYRAAGKALAEQAPGGVVVELKDAANGLHAHHSMVSCGTGFQDQISKNDRAGYTTIYRPGTGNFERALRLMIKEEVLS